jgi:hypothetical protein
MPVVPVTGSSKRIMVQAGLDINIRPYLKNKQSKKDWGALLKRYSVNLASLQP